MKNTTKTLPLPPFSFSLAQAFRETQTADLSAVAVYAAAYNIEGACLLNAGRSFTPAAEWFQLMLNNSHAPEFLAAFNPVE